MDNQSDQSAVSSNLPLINSVLLAATCSVLLVVFLTVVGELYSPLKVSLQETFYHHWVGKGVLSIISFIFITALTYPLTKRNDTLSKSALVMLTTALVVGSLVLFFFFVYEYLIHH